MKIDQAGLKLILTELTQNPKTFELFEKLRIYGDQSRLYKTLEEKLVYDLSYMKMDLPQLISALKEYNTIKPAKEFEAISRELYQHPIHPICMDLYYAMAEPFLLRKIVKQEILYTAFKLFDPKRIFVGGVGSGEILDIIEQMPMSDAKQIKIEAVDVSQPSIDYCKAKYSGSQFKLDFRLGDLDRIEFKQDYDLAELSEVLEHIRDPQALLSKLARCCKNMLVTIPLGLDVADHLHVFKPQHIKEMLNNAGLDPICQTIRGGIYIKQFFYFGLLKKV